ncbi:MAG: hypothetical protein R6U29_10880 [Desulfosudaceae bacterium]
MHTRTCVSPRGKFIYGLHKPSYQVTNLRPRDHIEILGRTPDGTPHQNQVNFPEKDVTTEAADQVFEIPNPFPFRGTTYISCRWADRTANAPEKIGLPPRAAVSFTDTAENWRQTARPGLDPCRDLIADLPEPLQLALAVSSTDSRDLVRLARLSASFDFEADETTPAGLKYQPDERGRPRPEIHRQDLFEAVANNPYLPDTYKLVMVLRPGAQGDSPITAEWSGERFDSHVFEYLRQNSYIPWGHFAANLAHDRICYRLGDLTPDDLRAMRHLYYQRTYIRLAEALGLELPPRRATMAADQLESLRLEIVDRLAHDAPGAAASLDATIWGWNFGFDFAPTGYRLNGSHQQIHQQYAMSPAMVTTPEGGQIPSYSCGDMVSAFIRDYFALTGQYFFDDYIKAITTNTRTDGREGESSLIIYQDDRVLLFVPKAQTSQWEVQVMTRRPVGNILEADPDTRRSLDHVLHLAVKSLAGLGAEMITGIEYAKRISCRDLDQHLVYAFLPRLPESPGSFSEAQLRWINGHYPEDFAAACRLQLP